MSFEPLVYAFRSITLVHAVIFVALVMLPAFVPSKYRAGNNDFASFPFNAVMILAGYFLFAPVVGQIFGDKFAFAQVWPSSAVLGMIFAAILVAVAYLNESRSSSVGFLVFAFLVGSLFLGLALNLFLYFFPRAVGWGVVEVPKAPWGVAL